MAISSHQSIDDVHKFTGASSKSRQVGKRVLALAAVRQEKTQFDAKGPVRPGQASGDRLRFPVSTGNSLVTEPEESALEDSSSMPERKQHASSSGRNESHNPNLQASGGRLQSKEDDDMTSPGAKLLPNLVARIQENHTNTFGKLDVDKFPSQHCTIVYFRTRLHVGIIPKEQISRDMHQRLSELFLLKYAGRTEHLLGNEHDEGALDSVSASEIWDQKAEAVMKKLQVQE